FYLTPNNYVGMESTPPAQTRVFHILHPATTPNANPRGDQSGILTATREIEVTDSTLGGPVWHTTLDATSKTLQLQRIR
ncbi:hypothetical protein AAMO2058_001202100, partial [Amorphochlora amoebiformis]